MQLSIDTLTIFGTTINTPTPTSEEFAPAQFLDLTDADKLSLPSFSRFDAGIEAAATAIDLGTSTRTRTVLTPLAYETTIIDSQPAPPPATQYILSATALLTMNDSAQPPQPGLHRYTPNAATTPLITLAPDHWLITDTTTLTPNTEITSDGSKLGTRLALQQYLTANPSQTGQLQVALTQEPA